MMSVGEFCNREVVIARKTDKVLEAAARMRRYHVGCLVLVVDDDGTRRPIGVFTDRDIVVGVLATDVEHLRELEIGDVTLRELVAIDENDSLLSAVRRMRAHGIRRLPVVDAEGALVGLVTFDDLVELLARELQNLGTLLERERDHEAAERL